MYTLRLMGSLDHIHQEKFRDWELRLKKENKCPNCTAILEIVTKKYHDNKDDLMVKADLVCLSCHWSRSFDMPYHEITR